MPQMRATMSRTSSGWRPTTSRSKKRGASKMESSALTTSSPRTTTRKRPSPSTRDMESTAKVRSHRTLGGVSCGVPCSCRTSFDLAAGCSRPGSTARRMPGGPPAASMTSRSSGAQAVKPAKRAATRSSERPSEPRYQSARLPPFAASRGPKQP